MVYSCLAQSGRECFPKEVRQRGKTMRRDGAEAAVPGEGDQERWHSDAGYRGESRGASATRDDRFRSNHYHFDRILSVLCCLFGGFL